MDRREAASPPAVYPGRADETILSDRQSWEARLPLRRRATPAGAFERLMELQRAGVRIRPRALVTTLWARLALGDLFIHGIGGAKYDCVTDRLIERFFGLTPPRFMVVSATLHLPIQRRRRRGRRRSGDPTRIASHDVSAGAVSRWRVRLPETQHGAQPIGTSRGDGAGCRRGSTKWKESGDNLLRPPSRDLVAEKRRWVATPQTAQECAGALPGHSPHQRRSAAVARRTPRTTRRTFGRNFAEAASRKRLGMAGVCFLSLSRVYVARILVGLLHRTV